MKYIKTVIFAGILVLGFTQMVLADVTYTVREGETAQAIADKFHVCIDDFLLHNSLSADDILEAGTKVVIPYIVDSNSTVTEPTIEYSVVQGDNLSKIAGMFDCEISDILSLNNLRRSSILSIDQILLIPNPEYNEDSEPDNIFKALGEIQINVSADQIQGMNLLDLSKLDEVQIASDIEPEDSDESENNQPERINVLYRSVEIPGQKDEETVEETTPSRKFAHHRVKKGESVYRIAKQYDVNPQDILKENKLSNKSILRIGQALRIPLSKEAEDRIQRTERWSESQPVSRKLATRDQLVRYALEHTGVRYRYGGSNLKSGVDCSGYVLRIYEKYGIKLPHSSAAQSKHGKQVSKNELIPGDLVFFKSNNSRSISHVGIYIGNGKFVHASTGSKQVKVDSLSSAYYRRHYVTARRVF